MTDQLIQRASVLIEHKRFNDAERELRHALTQDPNNAYALALLGLCRMELGDHDEALRLVTQAVGVQPDNPQFLYLTGLVHLNRQNTRDALKFLMSAISFAPNNAEYHGVVAMIYLHEKKWESALEYANRGLENDAENISCLNARSTALLKLNRKEESFETIKEALSNDPHNTHTHANLGWGLLEKGDHRKALESFREALRLDPSNDHAKAGLVEALKARYWFYRMWLRYVFWMTNLTAKYQWFFLIGIYFGVRALNWVANNNPTLEPIARPIVYLYTAFALSTWVIEPLSNLFLRFNVYGRYALKEDEIRASTFTAIGFALVILGALGLLVLGGDLFLLILALGFGFMILLGSMFKPREKSKRAIAMAAAIGLSTCGVLGIVMPMLGLESGLLVWQIFLFGAIAYQWILNALITR